MVFDIAVLALGLQRERDNTKEDVGYLLLMILRIYADCAGYHGQPKPRMYEGNFWTHHPRRGAFGRKLWKKWFNNKAMNKMEYSTTVIFYDIMTVWMDGERAE
jgi:hypothetical protein